MERQRMAAMMPHQRRLTTTINKADALHDRRSARSAGLTGSSAFFSALASASVTTSPVDTGVDPSILPMRVSREGVDPPSGCGCSHDAALFKGLLARRDMSWFAGRSGAPWRTFRDSCDVRRTSRMIGLSPARFARSGRAEDSKSSTGSIATPGMDKSRWLHRPAVIPSNDEF